MRITSSRREILERTVVRDTVRRLPRNLALLTYVRAGIAGGVTLFPR